MDQKRVALAKEIVAMVNASGVKLGSLERVGFAAECDIAAGKNLCRHGRVTLVQSGSVVHGGFRWICADDCPERD